MLVSAIIVLATSFMISYSLLLFSPIYIKVYCYFLQFMLIFHGMLMLLVLSLLLFLPIFLVWV